MAETEALVEPEFAVPWPGFLRSARKGVDVRPAGDSSRFFVRLAQAEPSSQGGHLAERVASVCKAPDQATVLRTMRAFFVFGNKRHQ